MAKAKTKRKRSLIITYAEPTAERMAMNDFEQGGKCATGQDERSGVAYKLKPEIDRMAEMGKINARQHQGLARYRIVADERSLTKDSTQALLQAGGGSGLGLPPGFANMLVGKYGWETTRAYLERELGALCDIAKAIAVDDKSASQWAMQQGGALERRRDGAVWFEPRRKALDIAWLEIRMAGERLAAAIEA